MSVEQTERDLAEDVGGEAPLSILLLQGLLPSDRGEFENPRLRPAREEAEEVAEVGEGLDGVETTAGEERDERGVYRAAVVGAHEQRVRPTERLPARLSFRRVVGDGDASIGEKALESPALVENC